jgi:hypothetical protein
MFELVTAHNFLDHLSLNPMESNNVLWLTLIEFSSALENVPADRMTHSLLTLDRSMNALTLCFEYLQNVHLSSNISRNMGKMMLEVIFILLKNHTF